MGYSGTRNIPGKSAMEMLRHVDTHYAGQKVENDTAIYEILDGKPGRGGLWFVVRMTSKATGESFNYAEFVMISRDRVEFCWKPTSEFSGPHETSMPRSLFNQLTPIEKIPFSSGRNLENAAAWRDAQRRAYEQKSLASAAAPNVGDVIVFRDPIDFQKGNETVTTQRFRVQEWGRVRRLTPLLREGAAGFNARLRRSTWDANPFEVEGRLAAVAQGAEVPVPSPALQRRLQQTALF
ncbi:hypothetical protein LMG29542_02335 [Paraburkholderia humisilvae]|uniref:DUF6927 domain-containing protein n=2 Tax=Paraburkholderia humisilvae TaxID=627669 RepID=A0A6J5DKB2_9BURK|nr:hypothetical protein LMG29542_02335 [Paraburkholderia humisilvae]